MHTTVIYITSEKRPAAKLSALTLKIVLDKDLFKEDNVMTDVLRHD